MRGESTASTVVKMGERMKHIVIETSTYDDGAMAFIGDGKYKLSEEKRGI